MKTNIKRILATLLAFTMIATICTVSLPAAAKITETVDVIVNGGFEADTTDPWIIGANSSVSDVAHGGSKSVRLFGNSKYESTARQNDIPLIPNTHYTLSFWVKGDPDSEGTKPYCVYIYSGDNKIGDKWFNKTADWTEYTVEFNSGEYTSCFIKYTCSGSYDGSAIFLDDVSMTYTVADPDPDGRLVKNGDFETGTDDPWLLYENSAIVSEAYEGDYALRLSGSSSYAKVARQNGITLEANTDYTISLWAKGATGTTGTKGYHAGVYAASGSTKIDSVYFGVTSDWGQYSFNFNSGDYTEFFVNFSASSSPDGAEVIVDNIVIEKVAEPDTALIKNAGFETGTAAPWLFYADSAIVSDAHEGNYALRVCAPSGSYAKAARQENIPFEKNTDYVLTYWAKGDLNTAGTKSYHTYVVGGNDYHNQLASNSVTISSDWTLYTIEFNSGDYDYGYINFSTGSSPDGSAIIVDDFLLEVAPVIEEGLIKNPGFETGTASPWTLSGGSAIVTDAHEGSYALRVISTSSYGSAVKQNDIQFEPNTNYVLTYWAKGDPNTAGTKGYHTYVVGANDWQTPLAKNNIDITSNWTLYTLNFNSGDYTTGYINFGSGSSPDGSAIIVDDFNLQVAVDTSLVKNGDFEANTLDPWIVYGESAVSTDAHAGEKALRIHATSSYGHAARQNNIALEANTDYVLSFWAKGDPNSEGTYSYHAYVNSTDGNTKLISNTITISADWTFYTLSFNSGDVTSCYIQFSGGKTPDGSAIIIDDVVLEAPPEEVFVINGGFEDGTKNWTLGSGAALSDVAHEGEHSLRMCCTSKYASAAKQAGLRLKKNTDYILIFWAKWDPESGGTKGYHAYVVGGNDYNNKLNSNSISLTDEWRRYMLAFNTSEYDECYINFGCGSSPDGSAIFIDDVSIIPREGSGYFGEYPEQLVEGADIRIVSFNVLVAQEDFSWSPWVIGERPDKFKAFIEFYKPDVVGLQECSEKWHDGIKEKLADSYEFLNPDFGGQADMNCSPIIYNKNTVRVIASEVYSYTIGNSPRFRLMDIGVFERISDGRRFIVSSTHLDPGWEGSDGGDKTYERNVQAGELVEKARQYIETWNCPFISTGDMNCPAGDIPYNTIVNSGVLADADPHPQAGVVDHIFISEGSECLYTARVTDADLQGTSDHYPLIADIKLTGMPQLTGIGITTLPNKHSYIKGKEGLEVTGGKVTLYYDNDSSKEIDLTEDMVSGFSNEVIGSLTLTVAYGGFTATFEVEIVSGVVPGDVDGDGEVGVTDALAALRIALGINQPEGDQAEAADVDKDGVITVSDALRILRIAAVILDR